MELTELDRSLGLAAAVARFDALRSRESLADPDGGPPPLSRAEVLELLALGEVIARKAGYGRQLTVRAARAAGASWAEIGSALGTTRQSAWEGHQRWIDGQADRHGAVGEIGFDEEATAEARALAGPPD